MRNKKVIAITHEELINRVATNRTLWTESENILRQLSNALDLSLDIVVVRGKASRNK